MDVLSFQGSQIIHGDCKHDNAVDKRDDADSCSVIEDDGKDQDDDHDKVEEEEHVFYISQDDFLQIFPFYPWLKMDIDVFADEFKNKHDNRKAF